MQTRKQQTVEFVSELLKSFCFDFYCFVYASQLISLSCILFKNQSSLLVFKITTGYEPGQFIDYQRMPKGEKLKMEDEHESVNKLDVKLPRVMFNGKQFSLWKLKFVSLCRTRKWHIYLEATINDEQDDHVKSYLMISLENNVLTRVIQNTNGSTHELWESLLDIYENKNEFNIIRMKESMNSIKLNNQESIHDYVAKIYIKVQELRNVGEKVSDYDIIYAVFKGLPNKYQSTINALKTIGNLSVNKVINDLNEFQESANVENEFESINAAISNQMCQICNRTGHSTKNCWRDPNKNLCFKCGSADHQKEDCTKFKNESNVRFVNKNYKKPENIIGYVG